MTDAFRAAIGSWCAVAAFIAAFVYGGKISAAAAAKRKWISHGIVFAAEAAAVGLFVGRMRASPGSGCTFSYRISSDILSSAKNAKAS